MSARHAGDGGDGRAVKIVKICSTLAVAAVKIVCALATHSGQCPMDWLPKI